MAFDAEPPSTADAIRSALLAADIPLPAESEITAYAQCADASGLTLAEWARRGAAAADAYFDRSPAAEFDRALDLALRDRARFAAAIPALMAGPVAA